MGAAHLRRSCRAPFGPWERRDAPPEVPRADLGPHEFWLVDCYLNNRYSVQRSVYVCDWGEVDHLWIRRHDGDPARSWADLQRIKDELLGPERVALEIFPARSALIDAANMYHLWSPPAAWSLPFQLAGTP